MFGVTFCEALTCVLLSQYLGVSWNKRSGKWLVKFTHTGTGGKTTVKNLRGEEEAAKEYDRLVRTTCRLSLSPYAAVTSYFFQITSQVRYFNPKKKGRNFPTTEETASGTGKACSRCGLTPRAFKNSQRFL